MLSSAVHQELRGGLLDRSGADCGRPRGAAARRRCDRRRRGARRRCPLTAPHRISCVSPPRKKNRPRARPRSAGPCHGGVGVDGCGRRLREGTLRGRWRSRRLRSRPDPARERARSRAAATGRRRWPPSLVRTARHAVSDGARRAKEVAPTSTARVAGGPVGVGGGDRVVLVETRTGSDLPPNFCGRAPGRGAGDWACPMKPSTEVSFLEREKGVRPATAACVDVRRHRTLVFTRRPSSTTSTATARSSAPQWSRSSRAAPSLRRYPPPACFAHVCQHSPTTRHRSPKQHHRRPPSARARTRTRRRRTPTPRRRVRDPADPGTTAPNVPTRPRTLFALYVTARLVRRERPTWRRSTSPRAR